MDVFYILQSIFCNKMKLRLVDGTRRNNLSKEDLFDLWINSILNLHSAAKIIHSKAPLDIYEAIIQTLKISPAAVSVNETC